MQNVRTVLLGDERKAGLLPRQPRCPVSDRGGTGHYPRTRHQAAIPFLIGALACEDQVRPSHLQRGDKAIHVSSQRPAIRRHRGRVNKHPRRHDQSRSFPSAALASGTDNRTESVFSWISRHHRAYALRGAAGVHATAYREGDGLGLGPGVVDFDGAVLAFAACCAFVICCSILLMNFA